MTTGEPLADDTAPPVGALHGPDSAVAGVLVGYEAPAPPDDGIDWSRLGDGTRELLRNYTYARSTERSYRSAWGRFVAWCTAKGVASVPASPYTVADYLAHLGNLEPTSVARVETAAAAIACAMALAGRKYDCHHEVLEKTIAALRHKIGVAPRHQKTPLVAELVEQVCEPLGGKLIDVRDRAILTFGFLLANRGANLSALNVSDLAFVREGVDVMLRRSKVDQDGKGHLVAVPLQGDAEVCGVRCLRRWLDVAGIEDGAVFRSVNRWGNLGERLSRQDICRLVQRRCAAVELPATQFGSHSLRSGFATSASEAGAAPDRIRSQTGQSLETLYGYIRHSDRYKNNAASGLLGRTRSREAVR